MNTPKPVERAMSALKAGEMVLVIDDEERENEGDLVAAAELVTPETINFMASKGRGLICLAVEASIADRMALTPMVARNEDDYGTAFTVSVDAAPEYGVTTGISVYDRATTVKVIVDPDQGPHALRRPGHMFPLIAHPLGVLGRRGHTEASTDLCEMAGLKRAAVIVEVLHPDGSMARAADLARFAREHDMVTVTVEEIVCARELLAQRKLTAAQ